MGWHLFEGFLDDALHCHWVNDEAEVHVGLHAERCLWMQSGMECSVVFVLHCRYLMVGTASMLCLCDESGRLSSVLIVLLWSGIVVLSEFLGALLLSLCHLILRFITPRTTPQNIF